MIFRALSLLLLLIFHGEAKGIKDVVSAAQIERIFFGWSRLRCRLHEETKQVVYVLSATPFLHLLLLAGVFYHKRVQEIRFLAVDWYYPAEGLTSFGWKLHLFRLLIKLLNLLILSYFFALPLLKHFFEPSAYILVKLDCLSIHWRRLLTRALAWLFHGLINNKNRHVLVLNWLLVYGFRSYMLTMESLLAILQLAF